MSQRKAPIAIGASRLILLVLFAALLLLTIWHRPIRAFANRSALTRERVALARNWNSCHGNPACCARRFSAPARPHRIVPVSVVGSNEVQLRWYMAIHANASGTADIVSDTILRAGAWDVAKTKAILSALNHASARATLLDIGANIGWFTLAAAYSGKFVVAIEPFADNLAALAHSLCLAPPEVRSRVTLLPTGLGARDNMTCEMWTWPGSNRGNTHTVCDNASSAAWMAANGYVKLGEVELRRLDSLIAQGEIEFGERERVVVKIDVEGFEYLALRGATWFLDNVRPSMIYAEYIPKMILRAAQSFGMSSELAMGSPRRFLAFMKVRGYSQWMVPLGKPHKVWGQMYEATFSRKT